VPGGVQYAVAKKLTSIIILLFPPDHLGVTWHFGRPPQEIYKTAKKLIAPYQDIDPNYSRIGAFSAHLQREVANCVEEISQLVINRKTIDGSHIL